MGCIPQEIPKGIDVSTFSTIEKFLLNASLITLVSPYLSLRPCKTFFSNQQPRLVITTFDLDLFLSNSSDLNAILWLLAQGIEVRYCNRLHAKLIVGESSSLIGSANFTNRGIGMPGCQCNLEAVFTVDNLDMCEQLKELKKPSSVNHKTDWEEISEHNWVPSSPRIRDYFHVSQNDLTMVIKDDFLNIQSDLAYLSLPASYGSQNAFKKNLKNALHAEKCFKQALDLCKNSNRTEPAEITELIKGNYDNISGSDIYILAEWVSYCCS
jgi:hypothetical protein